MQALLRRTATLAVDGVRDVPVPSPTRAYASFTKHENVSQLFPGAIADAAGTQPLTRRALRGTTDAGPNQEERLMKAPKLLLSTILGLSLAVGCDASKPQLEKSQQELRKMTAERDELKTQLEQANARASNLQQQLTDLQSKAAEPKEDPAAKAGGKTAKKKAARSKKRRK